MPLTRLPAWAYLIAAVAPIVLILIVGSFLPLPRQTTTILTGIASVWAVALAFVHWKRLDEAARSAHRWAWYWGGSLGLGAAMLFATASLTWPDLQTAFASLAQKFDGPNRTPEQAYLFLGVAFTGVAQGVGFLGAWVYWWLAKR